MKKSLGLGTVLVLLFGGTMPAITVFAVKVASQADLKVYSVDHDYQADVIVYTSKYASDGGDSQPLIWYFGPLAAYAKLKIYYVTYPSQADVLVYVTDKPYKVGWVNATKKLLWGEALSGGMAGALTPPGDR